MLPIRIAHFSCQFVFLLVAAAGQIKLILLFYNLLEQVRIRFVPCGRITPLFPLRFM